jgi:serine/threonine protein kinase
MSRSKGESAQSDSGKESAAGALAQAAPRGSALPPGTMLGKYRIVKPLGVGGMAAVYEALHTGIGKPVAIKTLRAVATEARAEARFLREAAAASRLDHPHVVDVTDFGTEQGLSYLVMELLRGEDLGALISREPGTLDPTLVVDVMLAVCAGVFAAHESGVIHRDLKPQNIFLARTPLGELVPKVLDFGISKRLDEDVSSALTGSGALMGTTHYLSPEQVAGKPLDVRSDQYALGVILYEALTGKRPHEGNTSYAVMHSIGEGKFALPRKLRPDIPMALEAVVVRAMSSRPQDRFESVHGLGRALLPLASSKRRVIWSDYYERDRPPVSLSAPPSYPDPPKPPVGNHDKGTVALNAIRPSQAEATRTRSVPVMRPPAATRVVQAQPEPAPSAESRRAGEGDSPESVVPASRRPSPARTSGLRKAVVIAGLIALGAGGYAAWVDPDIADRIPKDVKASIKRHMPTDSLRDLGKPAAEQPRPAIPTETRGRLPTTTRKILPDETTPLRGGLLPPSAEEIEAAKSLAEAGKPDAAPAGASGDPIDLGNKSPEELAAAGSPVPTALDPLGIRAGTVGPSRRPTGPQSRVPVGAALGAEVRAGNIPPYGGGDATMRAMRMVNKPPKRRPEPAWTPEGMSPRPRSEPASPPPPPPPRTPVFTPTGAPILE